jgi:hypothetical protein
MGCVVTGVDTRSVRRRARAAGALSASVADVERALRRAELVSLAASPRAKPGPAPAPGSRRPAGARDHRRRQRQVADMPGGASAGDCGASSGAIRWRATSAPDSPPRSLGCFGAATWILVPDLERRSPLAAVRRLVRAVGGRPVEMSAATHDRVVAFPEPRAAGAGRALFDATRHDALAAERLALAGPAFRLESPGWRRARGRSGARSWSRTARGGACPRAVTRALRGASKAAAFGDKLRPFMKRWEEKP